MLFFVCILSHVLVVVGLASHTFAKDSFSIILHQSTVHLIVCQMLAIAAITYS